MTTHLTDLVYYTSTKWKFLERLETKKRKKLKKISFEN